jgi:hypothetical protein
VLTASGWRGTPCWSNPSDAPWKLTRGEVRTRDGRVDEVDHVDADVVALLDLTDESVSDNRNEPALPHTAHDHRVRKGKSHGATV